MWYNIHHLNFKEINSKGKEVEMKKLMVLAMAALIATIASAVQCAGMTKKGERCKREAAEGSQYCLGHADQAKAKGEKLKDDGTCWAVTEAGTRCKHKKDGESDYCKQHGPDTKAKKPGGLCRALKWNGERCSRPADGEYIYCKQHRKLGVNSAEPKKAEPAKKAAAKKPAAKK